MNVTPFDFNGSNVRVITKDNEPWFVAKDVCDVLGIKNTSEAVKLAELEEEEKARFSLGSGSPANIISESGVYGLLMYSRKPQAKEFRKWLRKDVIPSIRKTGSYSTTPEVQPVAPPQSLDVLRLIVNSFDEQAIKFGQALADLEERNGTTLINGVEMMSHLQLVEVINNYEGRSNDVRPDSVKRSKSLRHKCKSF